VELKLLPGLGHFWFGVERDLKEIVAPFLRTHLLGIPTGVLADPRRRDDDTQTSE
jgi:hypothetical protein